jgi:hypothetical protein
MITLIAWLPALVKALLTALIVVLASALAEALGPFWGALIASLPVSAGPAYVFLAMQHDESFMAASALSSCAANASTGLFLIVYATRARRASLPGSLGAAVTVWLATIPVLRQIAWTPLTAALLNLLVYGIGFIRLRGLTRPPVGPMSVATRRPADLPVRAVAVALLVSAVVIAGSVLGPEATGMAAVFPVSLISLIVILHRRIGAAASAVLAATALQAMFGFGLMLLVLHLAIRPWGPVLALMAALLVSVTWSGGLLALRRRARAGAHRNLSAKSRPRYAAGTGHGATDHGRDSVG